MSRDLIITGLNPVIHEECSNLEEDGRNKSDHDDRGSLDFNLRTFIVVRS